MGADRNKLLLPLLGEPILAWTLRAAAAAQRTEWIGILCQPRDRPDFEAIAQQLRDRGELHRPVAFIDGGNTRQASVYNGLQALPARADRVSIHDGARCLATPDLFDRCAAALDDCPGLVAAVPVKDTIKVVDPASGTVRDTPDRQFLWAAQTPQGFHAATLRQCHDRGLREGWAVTDDAALFEKCDLPVRVVEGEETNLKVTTPKDLAIAAFVLQSRA